MMCPEQYGDMLKPKIKSFGDNKTDYVNISLLKDNCYNYVGVIN